MTGAALDQAPQARLCRTEGCGTVLSRFNAAVVCASCSNRLEIGGLSIPLPPQPRFDARPPAPVRPTTEGGITLPGPVTVTPERSLAEMLAKPATAREKAPAPKCAECGEPLPKNHTGWLCRLCSVAGDQAVAEVRTGTTRIGVNRKIDYAEAVRHFRECGNYAEVGRRLGCNTNVAMAAVKHEIGDDEAARLLRSWRKAPERARSFDYATAVSAFRECGNVMRVARQLGLSQATVDRAIRVEIGIEEMHRIRAQHRPPKTREPRKEHEVHPIPGLLVRPARGRRGRARAFDWAEACRLRQTGMSIEEIAIKLGGSVSAVKRAIAAAVKAGEMPAPQPPVRARARRSDDPVARPSRDTTPQPPRHSHTNDERSQLEARIEQIKLLIDQNAIERTRLNDQARELLEEWGDINYRLSKLSDEMAA